MRLVLRAAVIPVVCVVPIATMALVATGFWQTLGVLLLATGQILFWTAVTIDPALDSAWEELAKDSLKQTLVANEHAGSVHALAAAAIADLARYDHSTSVLLASRLIDADARYEELTT